jgi:WD40 repeat protein
VLVSSWLDSEVVLWNAADPGLEPVVLSAGHRSWVWGLALAPDGTWGVSAGEDRTVRRWLTRTEALAAEVCRRVDRDLTLEEWQRAMPADVPRRPACP